MLPIFTTLSSGTPSAGIDDEINSANIRTDTITNNPKPFARLNSFAIFYPVSFGKLFWFP